MQYIHAVPVDVVDSRLWFQSTRVNPQKHQRAALLIMEHFEGQSTQVVFVPLPAEDIDNNQQKDVKGMEYSLKGQFQYY